MSCKTYNTLHKHSYKSICTKKRAHARTNTNTQWHAHTNHTHKIYK